MSRDKFLLIKSKIKLSKANEENDSDKVWKVHKIINLFRENTQQFEFFSTALFIDEMMVRFFRQTSLKQYLSSKPDRYGLKLWALCGANGYLFDFDVYYGKNGTRVEEKLSSCTLGSRVALQMVDALLKSVSKKKLAEYHLYFDNFVTSPDLVLHLKKIGLRSTGTLRKNRMKEQYKFEKKIS